MAETLLIAGTASHVGKSTVTAGLCRLLANQNISVVPFKAQNMSNNARVVVQPDTALAGNQKSETGDNRWGEIGVSQFVQAQAAGVTPTTDCNPVLLKPRGDGESQLILQGDAQEHVSVREYYKDYWERAYKAAEESYQRLAANHDVIIAEGAGSIGEINLHDRDLANIETAEFADAAILLLVDIERGGAFASLYGTIELVPDALRDRIVGAVITKFRGDPSLLEPGIEEIESRTGVPILGVLPYDDPGLPEEDSVGLPKTEEQAIVGDGDGVPSDQHVRIAVPRLPRISNATDLEALADEPGVSVVYLPVDRNKRTDPLEDVSADAVVLPGTKNTVDDLLALREAGFSDALAAFSGPIVGICGGYQILGERITNASLEGTGESDVVKGLGLLPVETQFEGTKYLEQTTVTVDGTVTPLLAGADGTVSGYEIHAGRTKLLDDVGRPLGNSSAAQGQILGTYLHGFFNNDSIRTAFLEYIAEEADTTHKTRSDNAPATPHENAAALVGQHIDLTMLWDWFED